MSANNVAALTDWSPRRHAATMVVGTLAQVQQWLRERESRMAEAAAPAMARELRKAGARAVCIVDVTGDDRRSLIWLDSEHACGWLAVPRGMRGGADVGAFVRQLDAAIAKGFVDADAAVLAMMGCTHRPSSGSDEEPGADFVDDPALLPQLSWGEQQRFVGMPTSGAHRLDLYGIVDSAERLEQVLAAGVRTVQLRIKAPGAPDAVWHHMLRSEISRSVAACKSADAQLFVNDHWKLAAELGAPGVHLGQEDLLALGDDGRNALLGTGLALGISSHSLWELCRARALAPRYIACGPVWPTLTKAMPWRPQGTDNLAWWCRMAGVPVVAIGGVLAAQQVHEAARAGADGVCIVRGLGEAPQQVVPQLQAALEGGRAEFSPATVPAWPHPSLARRVDG